MAQKDLYVYNHTTPVHKMFAEIGEEHFTCHTRDKNNKVLSFELFSFKFFRAFDYDECFRLIKLNSVLLNNTYPETTIIFEFKECMIIPQTFFNAENKEEYLRTVFPSCDERIYFNEPVNENVFLYSISKRLNDAITSNFPGASLTHKFKLLYYEWLNKINDLPETFMQVLFYHHHFIAMIVKEKRLHLVNIFSYKAPLDAVYHILNCCDKLNINRDEIMVYISGLIDMKSALYKELYQYIPQLQIVTPTVETFAADAFGVHPLHYFASFLNGCE